MCSSGVYQWGHIYHGWLILILGHFPHAVCFLCFFQQNWKKKMFTQVCYIQSHEEPQSLFRFFLDFCSYFHLKKFNCLKNYLSLKLLYFLNRLNQRFFCVTNLDCSVTHKITAAIHLWVATYRLGIAVLKHCFLQWTKSFHLLQVRNGLFKRSQY